MKMLNSRTMSILILTLLFAAGTGGILGWIWYETDQVGAELLTRVALISNQQTAETKNKELSEILYSTASKRETLETYVLRDADDTIKLLTRLEALAVVGGVSLTTNSLSVEETGSTFNDLLLSISVDGDETSVKYFIQILETLPYHGHIEKVQFTRKLGENGITSIDSSILFRLSIAAYD